MWGLTLLPRNVLPTIFFVLMSMNAISFESRFTIMTTVVGSATLTSAARNRPTVHSPAAVATNLPTIKTRILVLMPVASSSSGQCLEPCLQADDWQEELRFFLSRRRFEHVLQMERQPQLFRDLEVI